MSILSVIFGSQLAAYRFSLEHKSQFHFLHHFNAFQTLNLSIYLYILRITIVSIEWWDFSEKRKKKLSSKSRLKFIRQLLHLRCRFKFDLKLFGILSLQWRRLTNFINKFYVESFPFKWNERIAFKWNPSFKIITFVCEIALANRKWLQSMKIEFHNIALGFSSKRKKKQTSPWVIRSWN